ncbi:MAG TPA: hypothetical protein PKY77_00380 [Phycisphaerae bacterium]|nr:hypothetical protein [Phycisphaerae bacterium]HRY69725.1 hypothetical protein [Phycisphaerae bacterium]HSA25078.1 hypothetical protein [Phycisphaerae bacterium]
MRRSLVLIVSGVCFSGFNSSVLAVKPQAWTHEQPAEFTAGELENLVVTNGGEVLLGRKSDILYSPGSEAEVINALARAGDGKIYAASGSKGIIYRIDGDKVTEFATLPDHPTVFSLLFAKDGKLLAGTGGGEQAKVYSIDGNGKAALFYEPPEAKYVWSMVRGSAGEIYIATGTQAKLFVVNADGTGGKVLSQIKPKPKSILCLAIGPDGMLYGGTDEEGLIFRANPANGNIFVLYDAKEAEVSSIVLDEEGNIYAATASAENARPGRTPAEATAGKPDRPPSRPAASRPAAQSRPSKPGDSTPTSRPAASEDEARKAATAAAAAKRVGRPAGPAGPEGEGNAIYRVDTDGFVTEVFREPVMILAMAEAEGTIFAATGNEGRIYSITPADEKTLILAKLKVNQATCILRQPKGELIIGTANPSSLVRLSDGYASKGTLVSKPLDAAQIVKWGRISWDATIPQGAKLTVATRSGNVHSEEAEQWDEWSAEMDATSPQQISSTGARFLQYRLTFESSVPTATATLRRLQIPRIEENRPPRIPELKVLPLREAAKDPAGPPKVKALAGSAFAGGGEQDAAPKPDNVWVAMWKAEDPNQDTLEFTVFYREQGSKRWIRKAKEVKDPFDVWDSLTVPDGKYELRVLADDRPTNPPGTQLTEARISDPITVDNTAPEMTLGVAVGEGRNKVTVNATLTDALSAITAASYNVDSGEKWIPLAALDDIFDSPNESVSFTIENLDPGEHRIALRVTDQRNNTRYVTKTVTVGE